MSEHQPYKPTLFNRKNNVQELTKELSELKKEYQSAEETIRILKNSIEDMKAEMNPQNRLDKHIKIYHEQINKLENNQSYLLRQMDGIHRQLEKMGSPAEFKPKRNLL